MEDSERILRGRVTGFETVELRDGGPEEERVVAELGGGVWDLPVDMFTAAGYEDLVEGQEFKITTPTPHGRVPRSLGSILPPVKLEKD